MICSNLQLKKVGASIFSADAGRQIDVRAKQPENANSLIRLSRESDSNVKLESEEQLQKQCRSSTSTDAGIQIDLSDLQCVNALSPIC
jgi:hypothetical protein